MEIQVKPFIYGQYFEVKWKKMTFKSSCFQLNFPLFPFFCQLNFTFSFSFETHKNTTRTQQELETHK